MRINLFNVCLVAALATASAVPLNAADATVDADRIARLEARLLELESRLADTEQETKEVKVLASSAAAGGNNASILGNQATFDILANSAWRNLRWTQEDQWDGIRRGITEEQVVELLGHPPRSVKSMKPRVDMVYWYETSIRDRSNAIRGKISFKDGKVIAIEKPNFKAQAMAN
jgi:outer membrane protein assembly factor BamE (lipoprotein component of BamABCDE complex)